MPRVRREDDNAIAAAFRATQTRIVDSDEINTGAVCVPMMTSTGCVGVVAFELQHGAEHHDHVRALATTMASHLAALIGSSPVVEAATA
jgi:hypothetical protein